MIEKLVQPGKLPSLSTMHLECLVCGKTFQRLDEYFRHVQPYGGAVLVPADGKTPAQAEAIH